MEAVEGEGSKTREISLSVSRSSLSIHPCSLAPLSFSPFRCSVSPVIIYSDWSTQALGMNSNGGDKRAMVTKGQEKVTLMLLICAERTMWAGNLSHQKHFLCWISQKHAFVQFGSIAPSGMLFRWNYVILNFRFEPDRKAKKWSRMVGCKCDIWRQI